MTWDAQQAPSSYTTLVRHPGQMGVSIALPSDSDADVETPILGRVRFQGTQKTHRNTPTLFVALNDTHTDANLSLFHEISLTVLLNRLVIRRFLLSLLTS
jgi:hypothetical protein